MQRMEKWYVMRTVPGKEKEAKELMEKSLDRKLWRACRVLKKQKLFRAEGNLILSTEELFPGYLFIETGFPERLAEELERSREYPKLIGNRMEKRGKGTGRRTELIPVEEEDLVFLKQACGEELEKEMGLSGVEADQEGNLTKIEGALKGYGERITRKRLRKRYVLAEVPLFGRTQSILFGIRLPGDCITEAEKEEGAFKGKGKTGQGSSL